MHSGITALIAALNTTGVPFARDAWVDEHSAMNHSDYGVVEVTGSANQFGDDRLIAQTLRGNVVLYVLDGDDATATTVQTKLVSQGVSISPPSCEFLSDIRANRWTWRFEMEAGL